MTEPLFSVPASKPAKKTTKKRTRYTNRLTSAARIDPCPTCKQPTLHALTDEPYMAFTIRADLTTLDTASELHALLDNRSTYTLTRRDNHWRLNPRDRWQLRHNGLDRTHPVLTDHRCHQPLTGPRVDLAPTTAAPSYERCPF